MADTRFDWDSEKDAENQRKHGVSFNRAQYAFADPQRAIARTLPTAKPKIGFIASVKLMAVSSRCGLLIVPRLFE